MGFSSIAGRFGNAGQTDYSAANDLLCKLAASWRRDGRVERPIVVDWTAWGGIGMASRGSIPTMMARAGIDMLPPEAGIPMVGRELASGFRGELLIAQGLGLLLEEFDPTGGLDPRALPEEPRLMAARAISMGLYSGLVTETTLDPREQAFLYDHQIDGTPVLPGVMGIEAFAETARLVAPDWHVAAVEDVTFLAPFKFYRSEPRTVRVEALLVRHGDDVVAECRLIGIRELPKQSEPQVTVHFKARVRLSRTPPETAEGAWPQLDGEEVLSPEEIYRVYFHGPAYRVLEKAWRTNGAAVGLLPETLPANHDPEDVPTLMEPRWIELCFQTAGLMEIGETGRMGLPRRVARVRRASGGAPAGRVAALVEPRGEDGAFRARVVDEAGRVHLELDGYSTVELPGGVGEEARARFQRAMI